MVPRDESVNQAKTEKDEPEDPGTEGFPEIAEVLEGVPPEAQKEIRSSFTAMQAVFSRSPENAVAKKITSEHIGQMLTTQHSAMEKSFAENHEKRVFGFSGLVLLSVLLVVLVILLKSDPETLKTVLTVIFSGGIGAIGGYGYGKTKRDDD